MNRAEPKATVRLWEYPWYVLVTVPLLILGALLWLGGIMLRLLLLFRKSDRHA